MMKSKKTEQITWFGLSVFFFQNHNHPQPFELFDAMDQEKKEAERIHTFRMIVEKLESVQQRHQEIPLGNHEIEAALLLAR